MPDITATFLVLTIGAYLIGSLSAAIIVCKLMGLDDPRSLGSKNPGATNVLRIGGKKAAATTLAGDTIKGLLPILLAQYFHQSPINLAIIGLAAFAGHLYPIFFHFKGGKGVATAFGVIIGISLPVGICLLVTWLLCAYLFKISSLAALISACLSPLYMWYFEPNNVLAIMCLIIAVILIWRHRSNIQKLVSGKEDKI